MAVFRAGSDGVTGTIKDAVGGGQQLADPVDQAVAHLPPSALSGDEPAIPKARQVRGDAGLRDAGGGDDFANPALAGCQLLEDLQPPWVRETPEEDGA